MMIVEIGIGIGGIVVTTTEIGKGVDQERGREAEADRAQEIGKEINIINYLIKM